MPLLQGATQKQAVQQRKAKSSSAARRRSRPAGPSQILYIQMEFCPRTLAQVMTTRAAGLHIAAHHLIRIWLLLRTAGLHNLAEPCLVISSLAAIIMGSCAACGIDLWAVRMNR